MKHSQLPNYSGIIRCLKKRSSNSGQFTRRVTQKKKYKDELFYCLLVRYFNKIDHSFCSTWSQIESGKKPKKPSSKNNPPKPKPNKTKQNKPWTGVVK